ncbi:MAG: BPL-N domain-containing protein [Deinococcales bacterium]
MPRPILVYSGEGTGAPTREGIQAFLSARGFAWEPVSAADITPSRLAAAPAFYVPGGWAWPYVRDVVPAGKAAVRQFVAAGGSYIGVCAGSYFAADVIRWQGRIIEYDLDLFAGTAAGPIDAIQPWKSWRTTELTLEPDHPVNAGEGRLSALYWGGPAYRPHPANRDVSVLSRYAVTGEPAAIAQPYGRGTVLLMGCHLEIGWDAERRAFDLRGGHGAQWDWLERAVRWALDHAKVGRARV